MAAKETIADLQKQLTEAWMQKAQIMDKIQSISVALQGIQLGQQVAREEAQKAQVADQIAKAYPDGWDGNGAPVSER